MGGEAECKINGMRFPYLALFPIALSCLLRISFIILVSSLSPSLALCSFQPPDQVAELLQKKAKKLKAITAAGGEEEDLGEIDRTEESMVITAACLASYPYLVPPLTPHFLTFFVLVLLDFVAEALVICRICWYRVGGAGYFFIEGGRLDQSTRPGQGRLDLFSLCHQESTTGHVGVAVRAGCMHDSSVHPGIQRRSGRQYGLAHGVSAENQ